MAWGEEEWALIIGACISAGVGGILTSLIQGRIQNSYSKRNLRREKLEAISTLSAEAEQYFFAEHSLNTYTTAMAAFERQTGGVVSGELVPSWVPKPEALPHKTLELENYVRTFLPKKLATVTEIRRLEGEMQMAFASLQADIVDTDSSQIDYKIMMQRCLAETRELIEKIKIAHLRLREAASTEEKKYV